MASDVDVARRLTQDGYVAGDLEVFDALIADDFVDHDALPGFPPDKDGLKQTAAMVFAAFSDRVVDEDVVETTDGRVVASWTLTATHSGELLGIPPSNVTVRARGIDIYRCEEGRIVEHWGAVDMSDVMEKAQGAAA